ncbi:uncharacterized protein LOC115671119 [Syzygium oleosum]|uniref:uncharacterized protein LOC115671119 n=1 Tax=Syzygium oleosum TaxID=219896 RepID=UPI0011D2A5A3|nr:uncharacterized protein LOC115671119 [Syzygium oleosum]
MNDAIDSRVEALAFQYVSFGLFTVASNLWTLVAVVTAAVSVWSIRAAAAGSSAVRRRREPRGDGGAISRSSGDGPIPERRLADVAERSVPAAADDSGAASTSAGYPGSELGDGVTRGRTKFTAYYKDDGEREREAASAAAAVEEGEEEDAAGEGGSCGGGEWWESWERVLKARNGEMWWYRCQDTGVINGAVVRLWDESRCGSGRRDSSGCAVW